MVKDDNWNTIEEINTTKNLNSNINSREKVLIDDLIHDLVENS